MYWTEKQNLYYTQAFTSISLNRPTRAYSLLQIQILKTLHLLTWPVSLGYDLTISQKKSHMYGQAHFLSCSITTATGHVLALITICNRQVWLNITTLEMKDMNSSFSGLISLPTVCCSEHATWFFQHKEED